MFSSYYMQLLAPGSHPRKNEISPRAISIFRLAREMNDIIYFFSMGIYFQWEFIFVSRPEFLNWAKRHARRAAFGALCPAGAFGAVRINS